MTHVLLSRRSLLAGAALGVAAAGALAWRRYDLGGRLFNPLTADRFDLPPVPGLTDATGQPISGFSAADIAGKALFLNTFASWCPQCREEHQALLDFARSGAIIYGVAALDDPANTLEFLRAHGNPFTRVGVDRNGWLNRALGARGVPASFVLAPAPRIAFQHFGPITLAELQAKVPPALRAGA
ncbi:DsbE subfamily thiol:disulfide oxidoreductase [Rhodoblastus acidophilus]|uniref:redoxin family protein n=1 Tax=Rhodoblastus acidophilus TaxID=1074 RepID=UPI002224325A|nr:redoxin family protein [Rhodoblastus acidophilus]MCW2316665.1 DsbE subfamily thiol:disulfide oxidoreductase [Rhodoblastus acidophilus]